MSRRPPLFCTPLRAEARALRAGMTAPAADRVVRTGAGRQRSLRAAWSTALNGAPAVAAVGIAGALQADLRPGDVVVADRVLDAAGETTDVRCPAAALLAASLRRTGLRVRVGTLVSTDHVVTGAERRSLTQTGALAVDMESSWLLPHDHRPAAAVRVVADTAGEPLLRPPTLRRVRQAIATLPALAPALESWEQALAARTVLRAPWAATPVADLVLFVGSACVQRLVQIARRLGSSTHLVHDVSDIDLAWLVGAETVWISSTGSGPATSVDEIVDALRGLGPLDVQERPMVTEPVRFTLPKGVRQI